MSMIPETCINNSKALKKMKTITIVDLLLILEYIIGTRK